MSIVVKAVLAFSCAWGVLGHFQEGHGPSSQELASAINGALAQKCQGIIEDTKIVKGLLAEAKDDASSKAVCPSGYVVSNCRCSVSQCDGVRLTSTRVCLAYVSYLKKRVQAIATCTKFREGSVDIILSRTPPGGTYNVPSNVVSHQCPGDYSLLACNTHTFWYRTANSGLAKKSGSRCYFDCKTMKEACVIYAICFKRLDALPSFGIEAGRVTVRGPSSEAKDDSPSKAQCPSGFTMAACRCSIRECDGVIMRTTSCTAYASNQKKKVQAVATCVKYGLNSVDISSVRKPTSGFSKGRLSHTCPAGTSLLSCNTHTYWYRKGVSGLADVNSRTCSVNCAVTNSATGCVLYAKCLKKLN